MKEVVISSSFPDSWPIDSDDSWPFYDFDSWDSGSEPWENSGDGGLTQPSGTGGSWNNNNGGDQGGNNNGSHSGGGCGSSTYYSISKTVSYLKSHAQPYYIEGGGW